MFGRIVITLGFIGMTAFVFYCTAMVIKDFIKGKSIKKPNININLDLKSKAKNLISNVKQKIPTKESVRNFINSRKEQKKKEYESVNRSFVKPQNVNDEYSKRTSDLSKIERYYGNTLDQQEINILSECTKSKSSE